MSEQLKIRPYARLITMLGDQLIKDETIALSELIKNAYDSDSTWVKITFSDFGDDFSIMQNSRIIIEDGGCGMDESILKKHWLNPATPEKLLRKQQGRTPGGRILQGEKGIGRFAVFKLGKKVTLVSRCRMLDENGEYLDQGESREHELIYDFSIYDNDFLEENGTQKDLFLEDLSVTYENRAPFEISSQRDIDLGSGPITHPDWGTSIAISHLKGTWSARKVRNVWSDVRRMLPLFQTDDKPEFAIAFFKDGKPLFTDDADPDNLLDLLASKSVLRITDGHFEQRTHSFTCQINGSQYHLSLEGTLDADFELLGLSSVRDYLENGGTIEGLQCGDFDFEFYVFDFAPNSPEKLAYQLDREEKNLVKSHRTYLYRDGIRVMPYGDPSDDWLNIDVIRGTKKASTFLSNDQLVGCVYISHEQNPGLKDKTNREGLIEEGGEVASFIALLQFFLQWTRAYPYGNYLAEKERIRQNELLQRGEARELITELKEAPNTSEKTKAYLEKIEDSLTAEHTLLTERAERVENLAAVGLSIDMLIHDAKISLSSASQNLHMVIKILKTSRAPEALEVVSSLESIGASLMLSIENLKNVQRILPSTKQRASPRAVVDAATMVGKAYAGVLSDNDITYTITEVGPRLQVVTTEATLLQVFVNLFDNSLYWLKTLGHPGAISVEIDGSKKQVVFADSGPGVSETSKPYIFDAYFSGKGEDGRGLGLYIARTLLCRYGHTIELDEEAPIPLEQRGAVFVIDFSGEKSDRG